MLTNLPIAITTIDEAKAFLTELHANGESYHPEDDAQSIEWNLPTPQKPSSLYCDHLNDLMRQIYALPGNDGRHVEPLAFDPCLFLIILDQEYGNDQLQQAVREGKFTYEGTYHYCIEKGPDQYNPCFELTISSFDGQEWGIDYTLEYNTREDAEHDVELLEHIINIEEC